MRSIIGFSTGSLALGDFRRALEIMRGRMFRAVELSALREEEMPALIGALKSLDLKSFEYISFHAPSHRHAITEHELIEQLLPLCALNIQVVVHPNVIGEASGWRDLGAFLCLENMDKRKPVGRTAAELLTLFKQLPDATFCFDIGHARQVDPTMSVAIELLENYADRLRQVHVSEVNSSSRHERLDRGAISAFQKVAHLISQSIPLILESPVTEDQIKPEINALQSALPCQSLIAA